MGGWETLHSPATRAQSFSEPGPLGCELSSPHWRQDRAVRVGQSRLSPFPRSVRPPAGRGLGASLLPRADILRKNRVLWCVSKKKKRFALTVKLTQMWASRGVLDAQTCPCVPSSARSVTAEVFLAGHRLLWRFRPVTACSGEQRLPASPLCLSQPRARVAVCPVSLPLLQTREENRCFFSPLGRRVDFQASYLQKRRR